MLVVLTGPTASGKSSLALSLALEGPFAKRIEIISMDSAQVYRGMDVGTAKPSVQERHAVAHHLIDLIDPWQSYSAARFREDALHAAMQIRSSGRIPLIVGGTLLYGRALAGGLSDLPESDTAVREAIAHEAKVQGWPAMHARLAEVDPQTASRLQPQDAQRISRALELFRMTGKPMSQWIAEQQAGSAVGAGRRPLTGQAKPETLIWISLEPGRRAWLHEQIAIRFRQMLARGLLEEVRKLMAKDGMHAGLASMRCVGYRQCVQWLDENPIDAQHDPKAALTGNQARRVLSRHNGDGSLEEKGIAATRQFAKRQLTWLRAMPERQVFACDDAQARVQARRALINALETSAADCG